MPHSVHIGRKRRISTSRCDPPAWSAAPLSTRTLCPTHTHTLTPKGRALGPSSPPVIPTHKSAMMTSTSSAGSASGDPYYVFKDELESKVSAVHQKYARWKSIWEASDSPAASELPTLTTEISTAVGAADKSLKFLEQTLVMVEANRAKFEHIDAAELASRKAFVSSTRKDLLSVSSEVSSDAVKARIRKEEKKAFKPIAASTLSSTSPQNGQDDNAKFLAEENLRQGQLMREQDQSLDGLHSSVSQLNHVAVNINHEIKSQNKMLDELSGDVDAAHEQMNFVMARMSKLLKTKDKCQLGLIIFLCFVLAVMVFLVIYT